MIVDYDDKYRDDVVRLLNELQEYIVSIDKEKYNVVDSSYGSVYIDEVLEEVDKNNGCIYLYELNGIIVGMIVGIINNDVIDNYDFKAPKRGRVIELIVSNNVRSKGIGNILIDKMEDYFKSVGCGAVLISVFGYNDRAINFYKKNKYHNRLIDMIKVIK